MTTDAINLVSNPTFDLDTAGWSGDNISGLERSTAAARQGDASLLVTFSGESDEAGPWTGLPALPGHTYRSSIWVRDMSTGVQHRCGLSFYGGRAEDGADVIGEHHWGEPATVGTSDWAQVSVTATAPEGARYMYTGPSTATMAGRGTQAYVDEASVVDVT